MGWFVFFFVLSVIFNVCLFVMAVREENRRREAESDRDQLETDATHLRQKLGQSHAHLDRLTDWVKQFPYGAAIFGAIALFAGSTSAADFTFDMPAACALQIPKESRVAYRNPDGSCVQCSIGMCGIDQNDPVAALLLWDSEYGPAVRGGSHPARVRDYCERRNIRAYNITGESTIAWCKWACRNGRGAAIGAGSRHFQTLCGHDPATNTWYVCNNNSPTRIDAYTDREFRALHAASGPWIVILDRPPHAPLAEYRRWW